MALSRAWQVRLFLLLILLNILTGILGPYTLSTSPTLSLESGAFLTTPEPAIQRINEIDLSPSFLQNLPEFFTPAGEATWWQRHKSVYRVLTEKGAVTVEFPGKDGAPQTVKAAVGVMSWTEGIKKTGLISLVALIYLISAGSVFRRHRSPPGPPPGLLPPLCQSLLRQLCPGRPSSHHPLSRRVPDTH